MVRKYFAPALIGMDLEETGAVINKLQSTFATAIRSPKPPLKPRFIDALAKIYHVPLYRLLGGPYRREIELVGGLGHGSRAGDDRCERSQLKQEGFRRSNSRSARRILQKDIERVRAVREAGRRRRVDSRRW